MMKEDTPNGVTEEDWTICQNAVLGDANKKKTPGTDVIGKILSKKHPSLEIDISCGFRTNDRR